jgi:hypothetical protein
LGGGTLDAKAAAEGLVVGRVTIDGDDVDHTLHRRGSLLVLRGKALAVTA